MLRRRLAPLLAPSSVALVGATEREGALGKLVWQNLAAGGLRGALSAVNPKHSQVFGQRCYARLRDLPEAPELAVFVTPARTIPAADEAGAGACARRGAVEGLARPATRPCSPSGGSGCGRRPGRACSGPPLGIMRTMPGLNATFSPFGAHPGTCAAVAIRRDLHAILDWAKPGRGIQQRMSGLRRDVDFGDGSISWSPTRPPTQC